MLQGGRERNTYVAGSLASFGVNADDAVAHDAVHGVTVVVRHDGDVHLTKDVGDTAGACAETSSLM